MGQIELHQMAHFAFFYSDTRSLYASYNSLAFLIKKKQTVLIDVFLKNIRVTRLTSNKGLIY